MSRWNGKIPFHPKTGAQQHFPEHDYEPTGDKERPYRRVEPDWRPNIEFEDRLEFTGFKRGHSAAYAQFKRSDGTACTVFLSDLEAMMPRMAGGHVTGRFTHCKRGQNFGTRLILDPT